MNLLLPCSPKTRIIPSVSMILFIALFLFIILNHSCSPSAESSRPTLEEELANPPVTAKPWAIWYWMHAAVSRDGITADLEAMKEAGMGGAFLMTIHGATDPPLMDPPVEQLSPEWWEMVHHAFQEADRLGLEIAMHGSDGFSTAGGPWITPELSMQKVVWSETHVKGGEVFSGPLPQPETIEGFYRDIAVFAFPALPDAGTSTKNTRTEITTSIPGKKADFLIDENNQEGFRTDQPCWIQYSFEKPFTCRSITIHTAGTNYQAHRLIIEVSDDGKTFRRVTRLQPARHGWQDADIPATQAIPAVTAKHFRFVYDPTGSEPGAEDLDAAKWTPSLRIRYLELSSTARIHHFEGKAGEAWRVSPRTSSQQILDSLCISSNEIIDISTYQSENGQLTWEVPEGKWTILRVGHTSTGRTNYTGGAGEGLECDKFNPEAVQLQFDKWFGEALRRAGPDLAPGVLSQLHFDSWECGSQNWSPVFRQEFIDRRGYDPLNYLPVMAGYAIDNADVSERFLYDVRQTIAELVVDVFYGTMQDLAVEHNCRFSSECVAPVMVSDGMLHYKTVDIPMGEFWFRSPTHDKPNDILDAVSGAHIYGKNIVQAEAYTQLRMAWDEHPGILKKLGDRNFAAGINRFAFHVFTHNPWLDRKPGMTLGPVGLYFQRDQTWWEPARAWMEYLERCQTMLQRGRPVTDIAVFTGEEIPRRAILPERLVNALPGIVGKDIVKKEIERLANYGLPIDEMPDGVHYSANISKAKDWGNVLRGYQYDSFNKDALLNLAVVRNGKIELPGGASYSLLILPGSRQMVRGSELMSPEVAKRLQELIREGATIVFTDLPKKAPGLSNYPENDEPVKEFTNLLEEGFRNISNGEESLLMKEVGKGRIIKGPIQTSTFTPVGIEPDFIVTDPAGKIVTDIAWTHRRDQDTDIYFVSNQANKERRLNISLRKSGKLPELYDPLSGEWLEANNYSMSDGRTSLPLGLDPGGSVFVILRQPAKNKSSNKGNNRENHETVRQIEGEWNIIFNQKPGGIKDSLSVKKLIDWSTHTNEDIRYYSGTANYKIEFQWNQAITNGSRYWLDLGKIANIAEVFLNEKSSGVTWTPPYRTEITDALLNGQNKLLIKVTNTWANRLTGDHNIPEDERITWTTAPYRLEGKALLPAGLFGPVKIITKSKN